MKKITFRRWTAFLTALFLCLLPGCGKREKSQSIRMDLPQAVTSLDPQFSTSAEAQIVMLNLFEGLLIRGGDGELSPGVALDYVVSGDGLIYTFRLRQDAAWNDGNPEKEIDPTPVTAEDFVFAFQRIFDPEVPSPWAGDFQAIRNSREVMAGELPKSELGVRSKGDYILEITLSEPSPVLLEQLAGSGALPCNEAFFLSTRARYGQSQGHVLGNGPFRLSSWDSEAVVLVPGSCYAGDQRVLCPSVVIYTGRAKNSGTTEWQLFLEGKSDFCDATSLQAMEYEGRFDLVPTDDTVWALIFRQEEGSPFVDADMRRALALSVDKDSFGDRVPEQFQAMDSLIPHSAAIMGERYQDLIQVQPVRYRPEEAAGLLTAALERLELEALPKTTLLLPESADLAALGGYLQKLWQQDLRQFINLEVLPDEEFQKRLEAGDFQMAITSLTSEDGTPMGTLSAFASGSSRNLAGYQDGEFDLLLAQAQSAPNTESAAWLCSVCERRLLEEAVAIPLFTQQGYCAMTKELSGLQYRAGRILFAGAEKLG